MGVPLIHPELTAALTRSGHFATTGTVQAGTVTNTQGNPSVAWANVAGLVNIPCLLAAATADEEREPEFKYGERTHKALLDDDYRTIDLATPHRFVSGGVDYDILGAEFDSQSVTTRLHLREVLL